MNIQYALPIIKKSREEVLETVRHNPHYQYLEVWLDYIDDVDKGFVENLSKFLKDRLIVVFRRQNLEKVRMDLKKRLSIISVLDNSSSFIDLGIFDQKEELNYIKNNNLKIKKIVSYHNYDQTPDNKNLLEIIDTMEEHSPKVYKIAAFCKSKKDALRLLELLLQLKQKGLKCIVLGMGEMGLVTRIFGTLWGNEMVFAPKAIDDRSAIGQLTKEQFERIFEILKPASRQGGQV